MYILNIALPLPLRRSFDYSVGKLEIEKLKPGVRVLVPFGKHQQRIGVITNISDKTNIDIDKIKSVISLTDAQPILSKSDLKLLKWSAEYYQHPLGEVIFNALPTMLKQGKPALVKEESCWVPSASGHGIEQDTLKRAPRQLALLTLLRSTRLALSSSDIESQLPNSRSPLLALLEKGLIRKSRRAITQTLPEVNKFEINLSKEQQRASKQIIKCLGKHQVCLLDGVTGSGKTEVYIEICKTVIAQGKQVLILSPEIGLTPQLIDRIRSRINARIAILHSGVSEGERLRAWLEAQSGQADIIIGTRSAIWTPLKKPGLFIIDEEHDLSYKQQDGLKYSARDVCIMRGKLSTCPVVLGSATPSMESLHNVDIEKYQLITLNKRAGTSPEPRVQIVDMRNSPMQGALSQALLKAIERELKAEKQVMLFLNRRGYSPTIMCHVCGWIADCERCDMHMTYHKKRNTLSCHHCDRQRPLDIVCPDCAADQLLEIGHGTERLEETLKKSFADARILRIDRDSTRRKGSMESMIKLIKENRADILVGTQMLAKGHHFPNLTLVGIVDADGGLCSSDFRASERMAQLFVQVSGRAGREENVGRVMVQTHFPDHPLLNELIKNGYRKFSKELLIEREQSALPPFSYMALLRCEGHQKKQLTEFLNKASALLENENGGLQIYGPIPAPMEKRAGKMRWQLLVISDKRSLLFQAMQHWSLAMEKLPEGRKVRWSLDIDPQDMM
jgi:primosomal protein N' (replication factor Y) (superfamily II helicase)